MLNPVEDPTERSLDTALDQYFSINVDLKNASSVLQELNESFPLEPNTHFKRIRRLKGDDFVTILVFKAVERGLDPAAYPELDKVRPYVKAGHDVVISDVAARRPLIKEQYEKWNSVWPLVFHESSFERLKANNLALYTDNFHVWKPYFVSNNLSVLVVEVSKEGCSGPEDESSDLVVYEKSTLLDDCSKNGPEYPFDHPSLSALSSEPRNRRVVRNGKIPYLLSGCLAILASEPCIMCSMAFLHSRIDAVIYLKSSPDYGALGSNCMLHTIDSLNHRFHVYQYLE